ncbi:unnamed protein product [Paramecium primaurelia]|uniref:Uncharacterized protein n=1 Tax=Paramecium primaurelia TaxID=5886 RepID=A0A8S1QJC1_PARPR|nr:unnamed protein product [Paramecium primaurelia]
MIYSLPIISRFSVYVLYSLAQYLTTRALVGQFVNYLITVSLAHAYPSYRKLQRQAPNVSITSYSGFVSSLVSLIDKDRLEKLMIGLSKGIPFLKTYKRG